MDDFQKPYEYNEEKRGLLLLFIILLISVDIFIAISYTVQVYDVFKAIPVLKNGYLVIGILFTLFILFTAVNCYRLKANMVTISKIYLIVRSVFSICSLIIVYINAINDESMIGNGASKYSSTSELTFTVLFAPLAYTLLFCTLWFLYFVKSKRCREFAKKQGDI